jgi:hypothetical protein
MTKRPNPSRSRPIRISPDATALFKWTVYRVGSAPLLIQATELVVTAGGGLDFKGNGTTPTGGTVPVTFLAVPPGGYSHVIIGG